MKREYLEELNIDIEVGNLIDVVENIFELNGKKAHEIVFMYKIFMNDESQYKEEYEINDGAGAFKAKWINVDEFVSGNKKMYPKMLVSHLKN